MLGFRQQYNAQTFSGAFSFEIQKRSFDETGDGECLILVSLSKVTGNSVSLGMFLNPPVPWRNTFDGCECYAKQSKWPDLLAAVVTWLYLVLITEQTSSRARDR